MPDDVTIESAGSFDGHRAHEIVFTAENSTMAERFAWLEEMLELLEPRMPELLRNRELDAGRQYPSHRQAID